MTRPEKRQKAKKFLRRTNLKQGQISEIWPKKGQPGNPACDCHQVSGIFVSKAILWKRTSKNVLFMGFMKKHTLLYHVRRKLTSLTQFLLRISQKCTVIIGSNPLKTQNKAIWGWVIVLPVLMVSIYMHTYFCKFWNFVTCCFFVFSLIFPTLLLKIFQIWYFYLATLRTGRTRRLGSQILVVRFPRFLHAPTQNSKGLEKSTSTVVAIPKPEKSLGDPETYLPISLLCVSFKILERLVYTRVEPIIDPLLQQEQRGFRHGRSTVDQVTPLTQDVKDSFSAKNKALAVFVNLTAAYDTVWHRGLTCKLLRFYLLIDTWSTWSSRWLSIAALLLPPEIANGAGYDASRTASHRDLSWHPFSSIFTSLTCQPRSPESMHMLTS